MLDPTDLGSVRAFVGVPLPDAVLDGLTGVQQRIAKASGRAVKWAEPDVMHLTLEFLGDVPRWVLADLPPVLDFETARESAQGATEASQQLLADVATWLSTVSAATGRTCLLYTGPGFWNAFGDHDLGSYPLWVAEYGVSQPKPVDGWTAWTFWQYSESGTVDGVDGAVDLDQFAGDAAALAALAVP